MKLKYRADIDGLRALAVLAVLFYHAHIPPFTGGFVGVDVFFVISGFLITQYLVGQVREKGTLDFAEFYARRIKRLFPAIFALVLSTILAWAIFVAGEPQFTERFTRSVRSAVFGLANIFYLANTGSYFDGASDEMPLLHFWSLAVEEQFYLVFPLFIWTLYKLKFDFKRSMIATALASFILTLVFQYRGMDSAAFYLMPARAWELAIGGILGAIALPRAQRWMTPVGLALVFLPMFFYTIETPFPGVAALPPVFGTALLIVGAPRALAHPWLVRTGLLSYGIYLWHWPFLAIMKFAALGEEPTMVARVGVIALSFAAAALSQRYIENPIRFGAWIGSLQPRTVIISGLLMASLLAGAAQMLSRLEAWTHPEGLIAEAKALEEPKLKSCWKEKILKFPDGCTSDFSKGEATSRILLWGNSHAISFLPMLEKTAAERAWSVTTYAQGEGNFGTIYPGDLLIAGDRRLTQTGRERNEFWLARVREMGKGARPLSLIMANRWPFYQGKALALSDQHPFFLDREKTAEGSIAMLDRAVRETITTVREAGVGRVLIVLPYPEFRYPAVGCLLRKPDECWMKKEDIESYRAPFVELLTKIANEVPDVKVVDPVPVFCNAERCDQWIDGEPIVGDSHHPSAWAARRFGDRIREELEWLGGKSNRTK